MRTNRKTENRIKGGERAERVDSEAREDGQSSVEGGGWAHISIISLTPMSRNREASREPAGWER